MSVGDDELTRIREARRAEIEQQLSTQAEQQVAAEQAEAAAHQEAAALSQAMRTILTPEARERLARVEMGFPDLAISVKRHLSTLHNSGRIAVPVDDATLKRILQGLSEKNTREVNIRRI